MDALSYTVVGSAAPAISSGNTENSSGIAGGYAMAPVDDAHAYPTLPIGSVAIYDERDRRPEHDKLFMTITDKGRQFIVKASKTADGWFAHAPNHLALGLKRVGPMTEEFLMSRVQGRVVGCLAKLA